MNYELKKINRKTINIKEVKDTLSFARSKYPASSNSLDNLCKRFNIDLSRRTKHNALLDCELLREVYINLVGEKEPSLAFKENNNLLDKTNNIKKIITDREQIFIKPSDDEFAKHNHFLKSELKKNFF